MFGFGGPIAQVAPDGRRSMRYRDHYTVTTIVSDVTERMQKDKKIPQKIILCLGELFNLSRARQCVASGSRRLSQESALLLIELRTNQATR